MMATENAMPSLAIFLENLKLSPLQDVFSSQGLDSVFEILEYDDNQLRDIGVEKPGHRKRMLKELTTLRMRCKIETERKSSFIGEDCPEINKTSGHLYELSTKNRDDEPETNHDDEIKEAEPEDIPLQVPECGAEEPPPLPTKGKTKILPPVPPPRIISPDSQNHAIVPEIPPRIDLDEQPKPEGLTSSFNAEQDHINVEKKHSSFSDLETSFQETGKVPTRAVTLPAPGPTAKRRAPTPPLKSSSFRFKSVTGNQNSSEKGKETGEQESKQENEIVNTQINNSSLAKNLSLNIQPTEGPMPVQPDVGKIQLKEELLKKFNAAISPKRPAPQPPTIDIDDSKAEDASSDSDDETLPNEAETPRDNPPMTSLLEPELQRQGKRLSFDKRKSRMSFIGKSGFLEKRGGQNNKKGFKRRFVVFDGNDLRYYKPNDKDTKSECLQIVPVSRMVDIKFVTGGKKSQFSLETPNRTFIFASDDHNEIGLWSNILMRCIILQRENPDESVGGDSIGDSNGGSMADPDKEGWLKKQGHNVRMDWKPRYVVVKAGIVAYYRNYEDYKQDMPINCLNMALSTLKTEPARFRIMIKTAQQKDFLFEAADEASFQAWISEFETSIQMALGDTNVLERIQENPSNKYCADCGKRNPVYASVNLLVIVCDACIGFHRKLGAQITKARSVLMDEKIWNPSLVELLQTVGNDNANRFWEYKLPDDDKIDSDTPSDIRYEFVFSKYKERRYMNFSQYYGQKENLGEALRRNVLTDDIIKTLQLLICGASIYYNPSDSESDKTPYQLAADANQELQMELLRQFNGHLTAEEREQEEREEALRKQQQQQQQAAESVIPRTPSYEPTVTWEKQGVLLKRGPKNNEAWRPRMFFLLKRTLYYQKENGKEQIDLKKVTDIQKGVNEDDPRTINVILPTRTFYLKGETLSEADDWYKALKYKQVFGVPIECQEGNGKKVPLLVARCIDYVENYALREEGIYRKNGSTSNIRNIKLAFNQDAPSVRLTFEEYPLVHDICGVFKLFLREGLPEAVMTLQRYKDFINNSCQLHHDTRLTTLYELIDGLPEVNKATLSSIVQHLNKIIKYCDENKMTKENVIRVFAPIVLNQGNSTNQQVLEREYAVFDDILTYTSYLFNIDASESQQKEAEIEKAKEQMKQAMELKEKVSTSCMIDEMNQPVCLADEQTSYLVKLTSKTTASDVCWYLIKLLSLSFDGNWALFEKIKGIGLERPLDTRELVLPLVMECGNWGSQASFILCLKTNYVAEMSAPYQNSMLSLTGRLHWRKDDDSWKKDNFFVIKTGDLIVYNKEGGSEIERLPIHQWLLYIGIDDRRRKSPKRYGFTLKCGSDRRYACTDDEKYMYRWVSAILQIKYPGGIWTNLQDSERKMTALAADMVPLDQRKNVFLGRKSTFLRKAGSSKSVQEAIQVRRKSLKKVR